MSDFLNKPNVASSLVERIPCSFAKPNPDGSVGTHYAVVLLDKEKNLLYVGSECEHTHGEGIQALHELGGGGTCFTVTDEFRKALRTIHATKGFISDYGNPNPPLPAFTRVAFDHLWQVAKGKHNSRVRNAEEPRSLLTQKSEALGHAVDGVVSAMLGLTAVLRQGNYPERVQSHAMEYQQQRRIFSVESKYFSPNEWSEFHSVREGGYFITMCPRGTSDRHFAVRDASGNWDLHEDILKGWAGDNHTVFKEKNAQKQLCIFCNEKFERMSRHTGGAKHIERVIEVAKMACKATSINGLKMLNNPRHRSVFLRKR